MEEEIIELKKDLFCCLIGLARACENVKVSKDTYLIIINALIFLLSNEIENAQILKTQIQNVHQEKRKVSPDCFVCLSPCGRINDYEKQNFQKDTNEILEQKKNIIIKICNLAKMLYKNISDEISNENALKFLLKALFLLGEDKSKEELILLDQEALLLCSKE